jgi:hypothetical protein
MPLPKTILQGVRLAVLEARDAGKFLGSKYRNHIIRVVNAIANLRVLIQKPDGTTAEADVKMTEMGTVVTFPKDALGSSGGASVTRYRVKEDLGACLKCVSWNGTTEGTSYIYVAKPFTLQNLRTSAIKQTITYTLTYSTDTEGSGYKYWVRTVSGSDGSLETQDITPPYLLNDEIRAASIPAETLDSQSCAAVDLNNDGRAWATR